MTAFNLIVLFALGSIMASLVLLNKNLSSIGTRLEAIGRALRERQTQ